MKMLDVTIVQHANMILFKGREGGDYEVYLDASLIPDTLEDGDTLVLDLRVIKAEPVLEGK